MTERWHLFEVGDVIVPDIGLLYFQKGGLSVAAAVFRDVDEESFLSTAASPFQIMVLTELLHHHCEQWPFCTRIQL